MNWLFALMIFFTHLVFSGQDPQVTSDDKQIIIERHNFWRQQVGVGPIEWSEELAVVAARWGAHLKRDNCGFYHSDYRNYGENLFMGTSGYYTASDVVDSWGSEKSDYDYKKNKCRRGKMCGHYTQIVWASTTSVGCAKVTCNGSTIWVCEYDPPGNWVGERPY